MNRFNYFIVFFTVTIVTLGIYSCTKDDELTKQEAILDSRTNEAGFYKASFNSESENNNLKKLAVGLSMMYNADISFKNFLNSEVTLKKNREVLLYDLFSCNQMNDFSESFNEIIQDSQINFNVNQFISDNPLFSIVLRYDVINSANLNIDDINLTFNYFDNNISKDFAVFGDEILEVNDGAILGFIIKESEEYLFYDPNSDEIEGSANSFDEYFSFSLSDCEIVEEYILNQCEINNKKIINTIDIQNLFFENCSQIGCCKPSIPTEINEIVNELLSTNGGNNGTSSNLPPSSIDCDRGNIQEDIILPNLSTNSNHLLGFQLSSYTEFRAIDNQPCKLPKIHNTDPDETTTGQNVFSFMFTWVIGRNGGAFGTRNLRKSVTRSELVREDYQVWVPYWKWSWSCFCMKPVYKYRITGGTPLFVSLNIPVFSTVSSNNHWTPDNQGEAFWINVKESDPTACSSTTSTVTTSSTEVGGSLVFSKLEKLPGNPTPTLNFKHVNTIQATHTVVVTGVQTQDLGNTYFEYCQPYPNLNPNSTPRFKTWIQTNTTGAVELFLYSKWH